MKEEFSALPEAEKQHYETRHVLCKERVLAKRQSNTGAAPFTLATEAAPLPLPAKETTTGSNGINSPLAPLPLPENGSTEMSHAALAPVANDAAETPISFSKVRATMRTTHLNAKQLAEQIRKSSREVGKIKPFPPSSFCAKQCPRICDHKAAFDIVSTYTAVLRWSKAETQRQKKKEGHQTSSPRPPILF